MFRAAFVLLLACSTSGCAGSGARAKVSIAKRYIDVDTSEFAYQVRTRYVVNVSADGARRVMLTFDYADSVADSAGKPPANGIAYDVLRVGTDTITLNDYQSRCREYSRGNCVEQWFSLGRVVTPVAAVAMPDVSP